jgi:alpha-glucosidase (family GH31 glycosyl hydrolase)
LTAGPLTEPSFAERACVSFRYLAPAPKGYDFTRVLYDLTGAPAVPPRHGMAFMATYWGYTSMQEVEGYMHQFRNGSYPIDSFIMDYDWFGPQPCSLDKNASAQGGLNCGDFGYKQSFWGNQTFVQPDGSKVVTETPADVLRHFHVDLKMRFGGIRKPRSYSNVALSQKNGWQLAAKSSVVS